MTTLDEDDQETFRQTALICDVDGTLAVRLPLGRGPYDWDRVGEDQPVQPIIDLLDVLRPTVDQVIFVSGRDIVCSDATWHWLDTHHACRDEDELLMRPHKDNRPDHLVKRELYEQHIAPHYDVTWVIDDRRKVVAMWRSLGLTVLQVADGDF